jgi:hypothetical protein
VIGRNAHGFDSDEWDSLGASVALPDGGDDRLEITAAL